MLIFSQIYGVDKQDGVRKRAKSGSKIVAIEHRHKTKRMSNQECGAHSHVEHNKTKKNNNKSKH